MKRYNDRIYSHANHGYIDPVLNNYVMNVTSHETWSLLGILISENRYRIWIERGEV